nr:uncharacterized protein LOC118040046 [Populus alba]
MLGELTSKWKKVPDPKDTKSQKGGGGIRVKSKSYLHSGDTKHVMAGMAIITLVFGVPWFLMNKVLDW